MLSIYMCLSWMAWILLTGAREDSQSEQVRGQSVGRPWERWRNCSSSRTTLTLSCGVSNHIHMLLSSRVGHYLSSTRCLWAWLCSLYGHTQQAPGLVRPSTPSDLVISMISQSFPWLCLTVHQSQDWVWTQAQHLQACLEWWKLKYLHYAITWIQAFLLLL